jgi:hypothetical protein
LENTKFNNEENAPKTGYVNQIYDKIFKKVITLSNESVINLINSLFDEDYSSECTVSYNWTESVDETLQRRLSDSIVTVTEPEDSDENANLDEGRRNARCHRYHMEAEIDCDDEIIFRVFDYGYRNALNNMHGSNGEDAYVLNFPEPKIIYIYSTRPVPDEYELMLDFGTQGNFKYKVQTVKLHKMSIQEINDRKMIILIPFKLLELREAIKKDRGRMTVDALQSLVFDGIIGSIRKNVELGNITRSDGRTLINMTKYLYDYLYAQYSEFREVTELTDQSILLEIEIVEQRCEERVRKAKEEAEKEAKEMAEEMAKEMVEEMAKEKAKEMAEEKTRTYRESLDEKDREIQRLTKLLEEVKS